VIEPMHVYADQGAWYVAAWCRRAEGERVFRVDRIQSARLLDETFTPRVEQSELGVFRPSATDPRVTLELAPAARWVAEQYPVEDVGELAGGKIRVTIAITARAWLERLLLRLGPDALVVGAPELADAGRNAAARILARYEHADSSQR
jgi:proteasome accessory factor C